MSSFGDTFNVGRVYELHFGHPDPHDEGHPFAKLTLVVVVDDKDHLHGYRANVFPNHRAGLDDDAPDGSSVKIKDDALNVRKSAVVMAQLHGDVDDLHVRADATGRYDDSDDEDADVAADGGVSEDTLREATTDFFDSEDVDAVGYNPEDDFGMVSVDVEEADAGFGADDTFDLNDFEDTLTEYGFTHTGYIPAPGMTQVNVAAADGGEDK